MISFAIGELNCPSLDYVYRMSWAEFQIRLCAYNRIKENEILETRTIEWVKYCNIMEGIGGKGASTIEKFMPLASDSKPVEPSKRDEAIKKAQERYRTDLENKNGNSKRTGNSGN